MSVSMKQSVYTGCFSSNASLSKEFDITISWQHNLSWNAQTNPIDVIRHSRLYITRLVLQMALSRKNLIGYLYYCPY